MYWKQTFVRILALSVGISYGVGAFLMLLVPQWFFEHMGNYPPYNQHYVGDAGSFLLVLGLMLLWAVRNPARHHIMITLVGIGSLCHATNHVLEDVITNPSSVSIVNIFLYYMLAIALLLAGWWASRFSGSSL
ncbi:MAG: hypothetical protein K8L97_21870 [Anaerolineae bacterium]|nr:hypothetical protein [Anaerolineae bacterium]